MEKVAAGGRPLQTTLEREEAGDDPRADHRADHRGATPCLQLRWLRPRSSNCSASAKALLRRSESAPAEVVDGFYSFLGFTRLMSRAVIRKSIARGIQEGHFGYVSGPKPGLSAQGKFEVAPNKVRFKTSVAEDEIDLDTGFLMLPQAIPRTERELCPRCGKHPCECPAACPRCGQSPCACPAPCPKCGKAPCACSLPCPRCGKSPCVCVQPEKVVELTFSADRNALYAAWNAIANLADLADRVKVTIRAESEKGFDK